MNSSYLDGHIYKLALLSDFASIERDTDIDAFFPNDFIHYLNICCNSSHRLELVSLEQGTSFVTRANKYERKKNNTVSITPATGAAAI